MSDLGHVVDFAAIRGAGIHMGVDPLGGAGVHYWAPIAEHGPDLTVVNGEVATSTFRFMTLDWDGRIRMDPSSSYAMQRLHWSEGISTTWPLPATRTTTVTAWSRAAAGYAAESLPVSTD